MTERGQDLAKPTEKTADSSAPWPPTPLLSRAPAFLAAAFRLSRTDSMTQHFPAEDPAGEESFLAAHPPGRVREDHGTFVSAVLVGPDRKVEAIAGPGAAGADSESWNGHGVAAGLAATIGIEESELEAALEPILTDAGATSVRLQGRGGRTYLIQAFPCNRKGRSSRELLLTLHDETDWRKAVSDAHLLTEIVEHLPQPFIALDGEGIIRAWNPAAARVYGYDAEEVVGRRRFYDLVEEKDRAAVMVHLRTIEGDTRVPPIESRRVRKDGSTIDVLCQGVAMRRYPEWRVCLLEVDVTENRERERRREFFVRGMDHRVKNTLAAVQAIAEGSMRSSEGSFSAFETALRTRLSAYARVHRALWATNWEGLEIRSLFDLMLAPYGHDQVVFGTQDYVVVPGALVVPLAMTVHELASNASRHGALSLPDGRVHLEWVMVPDSGKLRVTWTESDGPSVLVPRRRGFGLVVIQEALPFQTGADVTLRMPPEGVSCHMVIPMGESGEGAEAT